jgi:integrase
MLTSDSVKQLKPREKGSYIEKDHKPGDDPAKTVVGFGVRVTSAGFKAYILKYRASGIERCVTIGSCSTWKLAAAREEARKLRVRVDQGDDPLSERVAEREAPRVRDLAQRFREEHFPTKRPSYAINNDLLLDRWILPAIGGLKVTEVRQRHIAELHRKATQAGSPIIANRAVSCASKMFALATRWGMLPDNTNPCKAAVDRNPETKRRTYLKPAQFIAVTEALKSLESQQAADAIRLLMLTGCRRGEALAVRKEQIDFAAKMWRKPASATKQKQPHELPLSAPALELFARLVRETEKRGSAYLFPGNGGKEHLTDLKASWRTVCKIAGLDGVRIHDMRHSFAALAASRGATLPLIGALLGHSNTATTARYAHLYDDPQRAVAESIAAIIAGNGDEAELVPIGKARR